MSDGDFNDKGVAQAKDKLNGKAQPFLTTGGEAVSKRKSGKKTKKLLITTQSVLRRTERT